MRSSQRFRSAVPQLTVEPAWSVAAFHEALINLLRLITGGTDARGCYRAGRSGRRGCTGRSGRRGCAGRHDGRRVRRCRGCRRSVCGNVIRCSTRHRKTGEADECDYSHCGRMVAPSHTLSECFGAMAGQLALRKSRAPKAHSGNWLSLKIGGLLVDCFEVGGCCPVIRRSWWRVALSTHAQKRV